MLAKIAMLVGFFAVMVAVGIYCRKSAGNVGSFVLGGRNVGPWITAFAYGTSYFSAVVFVGYAGQFGWNFGISAFWIGLGNALIGSLLAWVVLGRRTRIMTKHLDSATMPDFFEKRYSSKSLKIAASLVIFIFLIPYSASVYKGLSGLFSLAFGIDFVWCMIGMAVLTAIYVVVGGYMAAALNDFIQGIIMLVGIVAIIACVLNVNGGLMGSIEALSIIECETDPGFAGAYTSMFGPDPLNLLSVVILTSLGTWGLPQMVHKFYTIKNEKAIHIGTIISTLFAIVIAGGSYFLGGFGRLFYSADKVVYDEIVPQMLAGCLPDILMGVVVILVLSASMSTLSSLVITSSSTFVLDFVKALFCKNMKEKTQMIWIKAMCAGFILLSVILAVNPNSLITSLMSISWGTLAGAFLGPFMYGLFWKKVTKASVWASFGVAIGVTVVNLFTGTFSPLVAGAIAILLSLVVVPAVSLITPKLDKAWVNEIFTCYDQKIMAPQVDVLPEEE